MNRIITALPEISANYDILLCDLWGCLHNGKRVFPDAVAALRRFREAGGKVILTTNSPRPSRSVAVQLDGLGAPRDCYDDIAASGDAAQVSLAAHEFGRDVYHLGPDRDLIFFEDENGTPYDINRVPFDDAESIVCTGLFDDETETPEDYRLTLMTAKNRGLRLLCANPDVVVDRGEKRIYCAGALAEFYTELGGTSVYFGKPHPPIYRVARQRADAAMGRPVDDARILCVGDGIFTDIRGGVAEGLDTLFITGGLAAEDTQTRDGRPDQAALDAFVAKHQLTPTASMGFLR